MKIYKNFISFEGIDFSGKTTQIQYLIRELKNYNIDPVVLREPGGTPISEKIRQILLDPLHPEMHYKTEIFLYEAARSQLVHETIIPLLDTGSYVIADRFFDSTTTYQGYGRDLDLNLVESLNNFATSSIKPYKTFFIDISPQEAEKRRVANQLVKDRLESGETEFFVKIRQGFLQLCESEPDRFIRIDGEQKSAEIFNKIWKNIKSIWDIP